MTKTLCYLIAAFLTYSVAQSLAYGQSDRTTRMAPSQTAPPPSSPAPNPTGHSPMSFVSWKQNQIAEAQEHLQRLIASKADEKQIQRAKDTVTSSSELTIEEYISVYLVDLQTDRPNILKLLEKLNKDESADILIALLRRVESSPKRPATLPGVASNRPAN